MRLSNVSEKTNSYLEKSFNNINRLEKLVNDLLDVTRINAGKMIYDLQAFDFDLMLRDTIESVQLTAPTHQIILESNVTSSFVGDRLRLEQVVNNLLSNAVKYSPEGKEVLVKSTVEDDHIIVSVQDYGIGIEEQHLHQLFDRYYRTDNSHMRFEGLGLGLFISAEIVKRHSGNLWIESEVGKGSCFYFRLPINPNKRTSPVIQSASYYKDEYITITHNEAANHLYADWTGYQKYESVKNSGLKILELVQHTKTIQLLNDNTNVLGTWSEAADWVAQELLPMLENAGLKFIAWIHSPSAFSKLSAEKAADLSVGKVIIRFFTDRDAALEWLKDKQ
jgi:anti-sigma regulatory factor (Ser/Thr protein kinase)